MNDMSGLKSYSAWDLLRIKFPPREWVMEPWLRAEETALIWAAAGVGKTFLSLSIALATAGGGTVGDWEAPKARKVILWDGEMNQGDLQQRIRDLLDCGAVKVPDRELALRNLKIIARQAQDAGQDFIDLTNVEDQEAILKKIRGRAELVIFDNLTTMSEGLEDENDATAFKRLQGFFMELKKAKVAAILVHHANKSGKQARGSTALETTFEVILGLIRAPLSRPGQASFKTDFGKFRAGGSTRLEQRTWTLEGDGWAISDAEPEDPKDEPAVLALRSLNFVTMQEIADKLGVNKSTVSVRLKKAVSLGVLKHGEAEERFKNAREFRRTRGTLEEFDGEFDGPPGDEVDPF